MRQVGRLTQWKDDQGYGFITPNGGGSPVFVNVKSFSNRQRRPLRNDNVSYTVVFDGKDRARAEDVEFLVDHSPAPFSPGWGPGILAFGVFFLLFVADSVRKGRIPLAVLGLYLVASTLAFYFYRHDKDSDGTLHFWSLIGGWPGAALAQKLVQPRSKKRSFQIVYWFTIAANSVGFFWLLFSPGAAQLRSFLGSLRLR